MKFTFAHPNIPLCRFDECREKKKITNNKRGSFTNPIELLRIESRFN